MMSDLALFDPQRYATTRLPASEASTLPPDAYTSGAFYRREVERIFMKQWNFMGRADHLRQRLCHLGDLVPGIRMPKKAESVRPAKAPRQTGTNFVCSTWRDWRSINFRCQQRGFRRATHQMGRDAQRGRDEQRPVIRAHQPAAKKGYRFSRSPKKKTQFFETRGAIHWKIEGEISKTPRAWIGRAEKAFRQGADIIRAEKIQHGRAGEDDSAGLGSVWSAKRQHRALAREPRR